MFAALKLPLILKPPSPSPAGFPGEEHVFLIFLVIYQTWGECFIDGISNTIFSAAGSPRASSSSPPPGYPRVSPGAPEELARRLRVAEYFWLTTQASSVLWNFCAKQFWRRRKGAENKSFFMVPPNCLAIELKMSLRIVEKEIFLFSQLIWHVRV